MLIECMSGGLFFGVVEGEVDIAQVPEAESLLFVAVVEDEGIVGDLGGWGVGCVLEGGMRPFNFEGPELVAEVVGGGGANFIVKLHIATHEYN